MRLFDLHCDTLYKAVSDNSSLYNRDYHISIDKAKCLNKWTQLFAIWIPDDLDDISISRLFNSAVEIFRRDRICDDDIKMYLSVENALLLLGDIRNIELLKRNDVKAVTLTWNGENQLGGGVLSPKGSGLTAFGKEVVKELEKANIAVDVSHASDKLFYDVEKIAKKPFIATHSNSRKVCSNPRNLTDDQFKAIRDTGGIVGLNFYKGFLNDNEDKASINDLIRHAEHFLNLYGENTLCIGSDFDGADMPYDISSLSTIVSIYSRFEKEFGSFISDKIFFDNAQRFFDF